jgi:hypothetical protein
MDRSNEVPMTMRLMVHEDWVKSSDTDRLRASVSKMRSRVRLSTALLPKDDLDFWRSSRS